MQQDGAPLAVEGLHAEGLEAGETHEGSRRQGPDLAVVDGEAAQLLEAAEVVRAQRGLEEEDVGAGEVEAGGGGQLRPVRSAHALLVVQRPAGENNLTWDTCYNLKFFFFGLQHFLLSSVNIIELETQQWHEHFNQFMGKFKTNKKFETDWSLKWKVECSSSKDVGGILKWCFTSIERKI